MKRWTPAIVIVVLAVAALLYFGRSHGPNPKQHRLAPDFTLTQLDGNPLQLSSLRGKVVLLDFWATWCDPCREEIPHFVELQQKYGNDGLQIIGVSMDDSIDPVRPFAQKLKINYPIVMGNAQIGELYGGVLGLPIAFMIGRDGRIYGKHIGATDAAVFEREIARLLRNGQHQEAIDTR
jgi:cytochrome c biogenesis protein CcmG/thiol:disulfide interchange protein DsbE